MSEKELRDLMGFASSTVEKIFQVQGEIQPMYDVTKSNGERLFVPIDVNIHEDPIITKDINVYVIKEFFKLNDVIRYVFISEAWMLTSNVSDKELAPF